MTALATVDKQDSSKLKYGLQGKTVSIIGKKTFFNYYKDKLLKDFWNSIYLQFSIIFLINSY